MYSYITAGCSSGLQKRGLWPDLAAAFLWSGHLTVRQKALPFVNPRLLRDRRFEIRDVSGVSGGRLNEYTWGRLMVHEDTKRMVG